MDLASPTAPGPAKELVCALGRGGLMLLLARPLPAATGLAVLPGLGDVVLLPPPRSGPCACMALHVVICDTGEVGPLPHYPDDICKTPESGDAHNGWAAGITDLSCAMTWMRGCAGTTFLLGQAFGP